MAGQLLRILWLEEKPSLAVAYEFWYPADARCDDRLRMCHCLKDRKRIVLVPLGRNDDRGCFSEPCLESFGGQVAGKLCQRKTRLQGSQQWTRSGDDKPPCRVVRRMCPQQGLNPFFR